MVYAEIRSSFWNMLKITGMAVLGITAAKFIVVRFPFLPKSFKALILAT